MTCNIYVSRGEPSCSILVWDHQIPTITACEDREAEFSDILSSLSGAHDPSGFHYVRLPTINTSHAGGDSHHECSAPPGEHGNGV